MKSRTEYLTFIPPARVGFENITPTIEEIGRHSGIVEGLQLCNMSFRRSFWVAPLLHLNARVTG